jgi:hypothetical protein
MRFDLPPDEEELLLAGFMEPGNPFLDPDQRRADREAKALYETRKGSPDLSPPPCTKPCCGGADDDS